MSAVTPSVALRVSRKLELAEIRSAVDCALARCALLPQAAAESRWVAGGCAVFAGYWTHLTQAVGTGTFGSASGEELDRLASFFHARHSPAVLHVTDLDPSLHQRLKARGYREIGLTDVLMREAGPCNSHAAQIDHSPDPELWNRTVAEGFLCREPKDDGDLAVGRTVAMVPNARLFLARAADGAPAAAAALLKYGRTAVLLADSTLEAHRGSGHHSALIRARVRHASESGAKLLTATTQSGSASERNYLRHGFEIAYSRVTFLLEE